MTRQVTISVNITGRNSLAETLRSIRQQAELTSEAVSSEVEKAMRNQFHGIEKMLRDIRNFREEVAKDFTEREIKALEARSKQVQLAAIQTEVKRQVYSNPEVQSQVQKNAMQNIITDYKAKTDSIRGAIGEGPVRSQFYMSREFLDYQKTSLQFQKQQAAEQRMMKLAGYRAEYGRVAGTAKYIADETQERLPLSWLLALKGSMVATQFAGNTPYTAGTLASSGRLLTGEIALILGPAMHDLIRITNLVRQSIRDMNPTARTFAENAGRVGMALGISAIAVKGFATAVSSGISTYKGARDLFIGDPLSAMTGRTRFGGRLGQIGLGLAGAGLFAYGTQNEGLFGQIAGSAGTGLLAGSAASAFGLSTRVAGGIGLAIGAADFGRRMLLQQNPVLPGFQANNPMANVDSPENRRLRLEISQILNGITNGESLSGSAGSLRLGRLQGQVLGRFGVNASDLGLTQEMLSGTVAQNSVLSSEQVSHIQNLIMNNIAGRRQIPGYTPPPGTLTRQQEIMGPPRPPRPLMGPPRPQTNTDQWNQFINDTPLGGVNRFLNSLFNSPAGGPILRDPAANQQANPQGNQGGNRPAGPISRRDALNLLDNQSFNFQGSQEVDIGSMHGMLQSAAIRDPAAQQDFLQTMRDLQATLNRINQGAPGVVDMISNAIANFNNATRPLGNALR